MIRFIAFFTFLFILIASESLAQDRLSGETFSTRSEVIAKNGMAATNHPLASQIAIEVLKNGGSAIDAAIAANVFLGLSDPFMKGLEGDSSNQFSQFFCIFGSTKEIILKKRICIQN